MSMIQELNPKRAIPKQLTSQSCFGLRFLEVFLSSGRAVCGSFEVFGRVSSLKEVFDGGAVFRSAFC